MRGGWDICAEDEAALEDVAYDGRERLVGEGVVITEFRDLLVDVV